MLLYPKNHVIIIIIIIIIIIFKNNNNNFLIIIIIIMIIIIITLFESQIILAEHECCTNWGDCKPNKSNQFKSNQMLVFEERGNRRKTSRSRVENQQTQPTYDAGSGNRTRDTLVEGERSYQCTNPAPQCGIYTSISLINLHVYWSRE